MTETKAQRGTFMNTYTELTRIMTSNPDLLFDNDGYQELPRETVDANKEAIAQIEEVLKQCVTGFVRFQNFKPRKDGSIAVRYQAHYNDIFVGVIYTPLENFK